MIFTENLDNPSLDSLLAGVNAYFVMTDQIADNLHDLEKAARHNPDVASQVNTAESEVRKAAIILANLLEQHSE